MAVGRTEGRIGNVKYPYVGVCSLWSMSYPMSFLILPVKSFVDSFRCPVRVLVCSAGQGFSFLDYLGSIVRDG